MASDPHDTASHHLPASEPSWDDLRIFLAVVAHGSMNGAARALGQSQPTVARRIRGFEEALRVDLFQRTPNRLDLTEAGRAVLEAAAPMAAAASAVPKVAAAYRPDPAAPVRITATMTVTMFLSRHAAELAPAARPTDIAFVPTRRHLDLASGEADIALRMRTLPDNGDLVARKLGRIAFAVYGRTAHPGAVIVPPEDPDLSLQATLIARYAGDRPVAARIGDMPIRYQAAKAGLGAAVLPCWLADDDPDLVRVMEPPEEMIEDVFLVMHRRCRARPAVANVASALVEMFKRQERALLGMRQT